MKLIGPYRTLLMACGRHSSQRRRRWVSPVRWVEHRLPTYVQPTAEPVMTEAGERRRVLQIATRTAMQSPELPAGWLFLADTCCRRLGRADWAVKALRTALVAIPGHPLLLQALTRAERADISS